MKNYIIILWAALLVGCGTDIKQKEIYQLGFRLAKETGITELFPVDHQLDFVDGSPVEDLNEIDKFSEFKNLNCDVTEVVSIDTEYVKPHSTSGYSREMDATDSGNDNIYLDKLSSISYESGNPLLAYISNWYMQNIFIWDI